MTNEITENILAFIFGGKDVEWDLSVERQVSVQAMKVYKSLIEFKDDLFEDIDNVNIITTDKTSIPIVTASQFIEEIGDI